jgi:hypothetical protein
MTIDVIGLLAGVAFLFVSVVGGGLKIKDTSIPKIPNLARWVLVLLGLVFSLPFLSVQARQMMLKGDLPIGTILAFHGNPAMLTNSGWVICNKENNKLYPDKVPNLEDRFLVGVGKNSLGAVGGREDIPKDGGHTHPHSLATGVIVQGLDGRGFQKEGANCVLHGHTLEITALRVVVWVNL